MIRRGVTNQPVRRVPRHAEPCRKMLQWFWFRLPKLEITFESPTHSNRNAYRAWQLIEETATAQS